MGMSDLEQYFPFWKELTTSQQQRLSRAAAIQRAEKGTLLHNGSAGCEGLLMVQSGRLRAFLYSDEGREITLYRLFERDICLFSASCMIRSIQFDISVEAEEDTVFYQISAGVYGELMKESAAVANYTNELMASRFSEVMWLLDQVLYKRLDARLAAFLLEESSLDNGEKRLELTHEAIARHLGTAREVITRMLKYFQAEGLVTLSRGVIIITDFKKLTALAGDSMK